MKAPILAVVMCAVPGLCEAGSFAINENSANDLGRANAGRVVSSEDALAAFGNPAMMTAQDQTLVTSTLSLIIGDARFADAGSTNVLGAPLRGVDSADAFPDAFVPALQGIVPLTDRIALGLSVNAPFGLSSDYKTPDVITRYQAVNSELFTLNINPSAAVEVNEHVSVGLGVSLQYADVRLTNRIDFGSIALAALPAAQRDPSLPGSDDGGVNLTGEDWSWGWNAGVALHPTERLTLGLHYRSEVDHELSGRAQFFPGPTFGDRLGASGAFTDTPARARLDLPSTLETGLRYRATDAVTVYADWTRQDWSDFRELRVRFANPAQPDTVEELDYRKADRFAVGADVRVSPDWVLRAGIAHDGTPSDPKRPSARIPDNDRTFYALGATFAGPDALGGLQIDAALTRIAVNDTAFARTDTTGNRLRGTVTSDVTIVSVGVTKRF